MTASVSRSSIAVSTSPSSSFGFAVAAVRRADPAAVPAVLRELTALAAVLLHHRRR
ncbi:hypothetical protein [Streptomyces sp. MUM 16J]|uniref:hypothetical protein n=1 Tax=Streptomyces sp. MUM 16J TaxID=2791988 RepID=UPI001F04A165|nr:hypothetical protein [Streptomyces sp. MUM 16J]MCH0557220.1 hypothetical protein [Streptomyces sp. MUM 16J]